MDRYCGRKEEVVEKITFAVETVWGDGLTFTEDAPNVQADVVRVKANSRIFFRNGITFKLRCNKLILEENVFFDCHGNNGADAVKPPRKPNVYCSGTPAQHQFEIHPFFVKFASDPRYGHFGTNAAPGGDGNPAANVTLIFQEYEGETFDPIKQTDIKGGTGGSGAPGGDGPTIFCTVNPCGGALGAGPGASSGPGEMGSKGSFNLKEEKRFS